jgi:nitroreductase
VSTTAHYGPWHHRAVIDVTIADELLTTTRAVRRRLDLDRAVPRELILECIGIAQQAPTGGNSQGWGFVVVTDADKRAALAELYRRTADAYLSAAGDRATDDQSQRVYGSAVHLAEVLHRVPVHVIPVIQGRVDALPNMMAAGAYGSIIPAAWSFMLAARARGLGTAWTTLHLPHEKDAAELLGIPDDYTQVALIPTAYYTGDTFSPAARPPADTITHWDTW